MKQFPIIGQRLRLFALAQGSKAGFSLPVVCTNVGFGSINEVCVALPDGTETWVERRDVDPLE